MPTYEYECRKCGHAFERFQNMTEAPLKRCPQCRGKLQRLFGTGAGIIFKGSGFYETDYKRGKSYAAAEKKESSGEKAGGDANKTKSGGGESKPSGTGPAKKAD